MKNLIFLLLFVCINSFATIDNFTVVNNAKIYSEYYINHTTHFKGTLIFFNGSGTSIAEWKQNKKFFQCVKKSGSLFLWDRSGLGDSPNNLNLSPKNPITAKLMSNQIVSLLEKRHIPSPYIVVAHSYGAIYAGYFILKNPKLIKSVLLIDPVPRNFAFSNNLMRPYKSGIAYAEKYPATNVYKKYNGQYTEVFYQMIGFSKSKNEIKKLSVINDNIPVVIISSTKMEFKTKPVVGDWYAQQKQWLNDNSQSNIFRVKSGHFIQIDRPNIVCNQIKNLVNMD